MVAGSHTNTKATQCTQSKSSGPDQAVFALFDVTFVATRHSAILALEDILLGHDVAAGPRERYRTASKRIAGALRMGLRC